nr:efflux RND transporter periplasmic adaptor subunit [uncultured Desulfobulbus sp.]
MARPFCFTSCLLCLTFACTFSPSLSASTQPQSTQDLALVQVATVELGELPSLIEIAGTLQSKNSAAIAAKVTGIVTKVPVVLGSKVQAGDLLVAISAGEITARVSQAQAQLTQARRNLERERNLLKKKASTEETVKTMQDQYNMALASYNEAQSMLGYTAITAPFDGVITRKEVTPGDLATPGTPLLRLDNNSQLQVRTAVPESLVLNIHPGDKLMVRVEAAQVLTQGRVAEVAPAADPTSRTAPVVIDLDSQPNMRTGQFARVLLPTAGSRGLLIPKSAVVPKGQMDRVFVIEDGRAYLRLVRTGQVYDGMIEILGGLSAGETVAISNNRLLFNGHRVQVQP